ncbi:M28 family peptidase [Catalinimonas niigatensis]|uniref:M28 family peptidase n=1 Tax=Catalinimonas niigatensis TaxID=1397264 RepID=UPI0026664A30|nr:M28 family peptidase [Catalinimonas niigatensis]WPP52214.1 M28 family peptidase [Catalinimonas niigatensis]
MKKSLALITCFLCITITTYAQQPIDSVALQFGNTITADELKEHLFIVASDSFGGRDTGSEELKMAADYLIKNYKSNQLQGIVDGGYLQSFTVTESKWGNPYMQVDGKKFSFPEDFYGFPSMNHTLEEEIEKVTFAGYGIESEKYNDYQKLDIQGKAVVILSGEPMSADSTYFVTGTTDKSRFTSNFSASMRTKQEIASAKGASLVMMVDENYAANSRRYGMYTKMPSMQLPADQKDTVANFIFISPEMAQALLGKKDLEKIKQKISKKGKPQTFIAKADIKLALEKEDKKINTSNVLAYIEGEDLKDEVLVITSHYDHVGTTDGKVYNGADDDGSGTVAVLEIAEAFAQAKAAGHGSRRSILFMNVSGEEKGLLGSEYYTNHPVIPLENTVANLNIDMIGRVDPEHDETPAYVYVIGSNRLSSELHQINEEANATYTDLILDYKYNALDDPNRFYYRSDHYNFAKHQIPIIFYFNGVHEDYHQPGDTPDKIRYDLLEQRARLVFHTAWKLANQDKRIEVDVVGE